jgi:hypothetical protein
LEKDLPKRKKSCRVVHDRALTPEELVKYKRIRELVEEELPELIERHHRRMNNQPTTPDRIPKEERDGT